MLASPFLSAQSLLCMSAHSLQHAFLVQTRSNSGTYPHAIKFRLSIRFLLQKQAVLLASWSAMANCGKYICRPWTIIAGHTAISSCIYSRHNEASKKTTCQLPPVKKIVKHMSNISGRSTNDVQAYPENYYVQLSQERKFHELEGPN
ncbi:hypothetical protein ARMGADRAFT_16296 [Armillaria gallica]|uniref:Uncharacterized protein n=1 Tax=Armillaria gallica TaxID=47427 RepID=A0A2H3EBC2_ARMGA|nr:hypothetical protein ARMGADRAFT_16296 [Armillaria gallica]